MTTDEMLQRIATLLHFDGRWHARASGQQRFYTANTPREAMEGALGLPERAKTGSRGPGWRQRARFD